MSENILEYKVDSRKDFAAFLKLLHKDFIKNPDKWENNSLQKFLEAMSAYTEDVQGYYNNTNQPINADNPQWSVFADIIKGATMYE
jgi:hypothetical protein